MRNPWSKAVARAVRSPVCILAFLAVWLGVSGRSGATLEETLPTFHWSYRLLDELRLRGYLTDLFILRRPFTRGEIARSLLAVRRDIETGRREISPTERGLLNQLDEEFKDELDELAGIMPPYRLKIGATADIDGVNRSKDLERDDLIHIGVLQAGTRFREALRSKISFGIGDRLTFYYGFRFDRNLTDDPRFIGKKFRGNAAMTELAYVQGRYGPAHFKVGRDNLVFGSGKSAHLLLSDNARTFDMYSADITAGFVKFTAFGIQLDDVPLDTVIVRGRGPVNTAKRYINGHRLDLRLGRWGGVGLSELVIYGGPTRTFELAYVNPINFYHGATLNDEDTLGRPANTLGSIDFTVFPVQKLELFGEFLIDDVKIEKKNLSDLEPDKFAFMGGVQYANPLGLDGIEVRTEYTRVANRTYNVLFNPWERFLHRNRPIAHFLGNNFDRFEIGGSGWGAPSVFVAASYEFLRQGQDTIDSPYNTDYLSVPDISAGYDEPFPFGIVQRTHALNVSLEYVPSIDVRVHADLRVAHVNNFAFTPGDDRNQIQMLRIGVFFNYDRIVGWRD